MGGVNTWLSPPEYKNQKLKFCREQWAPAGFKPHMPSHQHPDSECIRDTSNGNPTGIVTELCIEMPVFWFPLYQNLILDISQVLNK